MRGPGRGGGCRGDMGHAPVQCPLPARAMERKIESLRRLVETIERLRGRNGCPWDRKQTLASMRRHLIEECEELAEAIDSGGPRAVEEELGDLLMNIILCARIAEEAGDFDLGDVADTIRRKLERRHPHVFEGMKVGGVDDVLRNWEAIKAREKDGAPPPDGSGSALRPPSPALPALVQAQQIGEDASRVGFDWPAIEGPLAKVEEELDEVRRAIREGRRAEEELGDLLFSAVNLARFLGVKAETSLKEAVRRFRKRFRYIESKLGDLKGKGLDDMDPLWEEAKRRGL